MIAAAILVGLRVPAQVTLDRFPARSTLDYDASFRSDLAPLRQGFVDEILGFRSAKATPVAGSPNRGPSSQPRDARDPFTQRRTDITHAFSNDDMSDAQIVTSIPFTGRTMASDATRENGEPNNCAGDGGTAWYRYRSAVAEDLIANTFGTRSALSVAAYRLDDSGTPEPMGCDTDVAGNALVQFAAQRDATYLFQITVRATGDALVFNLEPAGSTDLVSSTRSGEPAQGINVAPSISTDGHWVAFASNADSVSPETPPQMCVDISAATASQTMQTSTPWPVSCFQVYLRNVPFGHTRLVSVSTGGVAGNGQSGEGDVSSNGRFVAFVSTATNLTPTDGDDVLDVFLRDVVTRTTEKISFSASSSTVRRLARAKLWSPSISDDGRFVAFVSTDGGHVDDDTNDTADVFVWDRSTRRMERASVSSAESEALVPRGSGTGDDPVQASISAGGRYVVFKSAASNLAARDHNGLEDIFVRDRLQGTTELVSVSSSGAVGNGPAVGRPRISADGRYVVFGSEADNLVPEDDNQVRDVFVRDRLSRTTLRVSVSSADRETDQPAFDATISRNGRYVAFSSAATTLAPGSRSAAGGRSCNQLALYGSCPEDLYVHDLVTRTTTRIPVAPGSDVQASARAVSISGNGGAFAFYSGCVECMAAPQVWVHDRGRRRT